jgi:HSP20 family protein
MTIVRWNSDQGARPFENPVNQALDNFFGGYGWTSPFFPWNRPATSGTWEPMVDVYETTDELVVRAELPGMKREDIELTLEKGVLTISGQRRADTEATADNYHRLERPYGRFTRSFSLPGLVDPDKIQAEYVEGMLTVRLPKVESAKPRRIEIAA